MNDFVIRRCLALIPTLFFASIIIFCAIRFIPGDVIDLMLAQNDIASSADRDSLRTALGMDRPIIEQYFSWAGHALIGDLGQSLWQNEPVTDLIAQRLPVTLELGALAILVSITVGVSIGVYSAVRQDTAGDYVSRSFSLLMLSVPGFWLATLVMVFPSVWWRWSPELEFTSFFVDPVRNLTHILVPAVLLGLSLSGITMRMTRTMMLDVLRQDYIRTARAKGLRRGAVVLRHAFRNALIGVVTLIGLQIGNLLSGAVVIETVFSWPGIGRMAVQAIYTRDFPVVQVTIILSAVLFVVINLLTDVLYGVIDPRIRVST